MEDLQDACLNGNHQYVLEKVQNLSKLVDCNMHNDDKRRNLLHLAVQGKSIHCIEAILKYTNIDKCAKDAEEETALFYAIKYDCSLEIIQLLIDAQPECINMQNQNEVYPIHKAIEKNNAMDILKIIIESAKKYNMLLNDCEDKHHYNSIMRAVEINNIDLIKYIVENTSINVKYICFGNALQNAILSATIISEEILNYLFSIIYGEVRDYVYDLIEPILENLIDSDDETYLNWIIKKIYFHESNKFKSIVIHLHDTLSKSIENLNNVIIFLHSFFHGNLTKLLHENASLTFAINKCYFTLFDVYLANRKLFYVVNQHLSGMWQLNENKYEYLGRILDWFLNEQSYKDGKSYSRFSLANHVEIIEFLDQINIENSDTESYFGTWLSDSELFDGITILLPFTAIPCADQFIQEVLPTSHDYSSVSMFCSQTYNEQPLKLEMLCRITVRQTIFEANKDLSNSEKLQKLKLLELSTAMKNFLFFNYTNYNINETTNKQ